MTNPSAKTALQESGTRQGGKHLSTEAKRALREAKARKARLKTKPLPEEYGGPKGAEPTRFGDWERKGIATDF